jgi:hypothetical protein
MCTPNPDSCGGTGGCAGATFELAFDYIAGSEGIVEEYEIGYSSYYGQQSACGVTDSTLPVASIDGYVKLPENNYTALMNAVATVGPVAIVVDASGIAVYTALYCVASSVLYCLIVGDVTIDVLYDVFLLFILSYVLPAKCSSILFQILCHHPII